MKRVEELIIKMNKNDIKELYFIAPIDNISSMFKHGLLSHNKIKADKIPHKSIAHEDVQKRRENKVIPGGKRKLHDYVNLYFNPRNSMMFSRKGLHAQICVLGVAADVLIEPQIIVTDGNASSAYTRFLPVSDGLKYLDKDLVFTEDWRDRDHYEMCRKRSAACAEVLVPDQLPPSSIKKIYVSCEEAGEKIKSILVALKADMPVVVNGKIFFKEA